MGNCKSKDSRQKSYRTAETQAYYITFEGMLSTKFLSCNPSGPLKVLGTHH